MRKPPTSYHIMNTKANHDTNGVNNGLLYVIRFFEGGIGQNDYSMGTIHRRKCTHCRLEITSTMPCCFLVTSTMSRHIEQNETRNKNCSFHMKRKKTRKKNCSSHLGKKSVVPSTSANTSNPSSNCPHALKTHFTHQCQHLTPPFQLPQCPQNIFHPVPTPQTPFSTHPMPSKHISHSANR